MYGKNDYRYYLEQRCWESGDFLMHYGVKGMKWKDHKYANPMDYVKNFGSAVGRGAKRIGAGAKDFGNEARDAYRSTSKDIKRLSRKASRSKAARRVRAGVKDFGNEARDAFRSQKKDIRRIAKKASRNKSSISGFSGRDDVSRTVNSAKKKAGSVARKAKSTASREFNSVKKKAGSAARKAGSKIAKKRNSKVARKVTGTITKSVGYYDKKGNAHYGPISETTIRGSVNGVKKLQEKHWNEMVDDPWTKKKSTKKARDHWMKYGW